MSDSPAEWDVLLHTPARGDRVLAGETHPGMLLRPSPQALARRARIALLVLSILRPHATEAHADESITAEPRQQSAFTRLLSASKRNRAGSLYLQLRPRYEYAHIDDGTDEAHAVTLRAAFGFGSRTWKGFSLLVEGEGVAPIEPDLYWDGTGTPNGRAFVPDPPTIELNQGYLDWEWPRLTTRLRGGRQRVVLDDQRWVGDVAWRQNHQSFDGLSVRTGFGRKDVTLTYHYLAQVNRIFGDREPQATRNTMSQIHLMRAVWKPREELDATAFTYLVDLERFPGASSNTYGFRLKGEREMGRSWALGYIASYAYQRGHSGQRHDAHYAWGSLQARHDRIGLVRAGFELLGSDDGEAVVTTPLSTAHAFNGLADAFLDNGGPKGLRDAFLEIEPELPARLSAQLQLHHFWHDADARALGWEVDLIMTRPIGRYVTMLLGTGYFHRTTTAAPPSRARVWLHFEIEL